MMTRRGFFGVIAGMLAALAGRKARPLPPGGAECVQVRFVQRYNPVPDCVESRMDFLYGFAPTRPEYAVRCPEWADDATSMVVRIAT